MKPDQKIALFLTFITGVFAGAVLYLTVFAPEYQAPPVEEKSQFLIIGETYGGCMRSQFGCSSFRLEADRSYQYLAEGNRETGELPNSVASLLFASLSDYRLDSNSAPVERDNCSSYVDGLDYRYEVTFEGQRYVLDTCKTSLAPEGDLQQGLLEVWLYLENPTTTYPTIIEEGVSGWLIERLQGG